MGKITVEGSAWLMLGVYLLLMPFSWVVAMVVAGVVHELGHCLALVWMAEPICHIRIGMFGAKIETVPLEREKELFCALAGPLSGLVLCLFWRWIPKIAFFGLCQSLFNLLPVWPMDGGRALQAAMAWRKR